MSDYFIANGPWSHWDHTQKNLPLQWGVKEDSQNSNRAIFEKLQNDSIVFLKESRKHSKHFGKQGIFGVAKVKRIFEERKKHYWPDEITKKQIIYPYRFELEPIILGSSDKDLLPWINGLPYTKGLNHIAQIKLLKHLIKNSNKKWKTDLEYIPPKFSFQVNGFYDKEEIRTKLKLSKYGGIRPSKEGYIVLFTNVQEAKKISDGFRNIYHDFVDKAGLIHYTGEGQEGDQKYERGNLALAKSHKDGTPIHYFRQYKVGGRHEYIGQVEIVKQTKEPQEDAQGKVRKVHVFWLRPVVDAKIGDDYSDEREEDFEYDSIQEKKKTPEELEKEIHDLNLKIRKIGPKKGKIAQKRERYQEIRNQKMVALMKNRYNEKCQVCFQYHFETESGRYKEVHHLIPWSMSHDDSFENLVVVCPTCHKKFDHAKKEMKKELYKKLCSNFPKINYRVPSYAGT